MPLSIDLNQYLILLDAIPVFSAVSLPGSLAGVGIIDVHAVFVKKKKERKTLARPVIPATWETNAGSITSSRSAWVTELGQGLANKEKICTR